MNPAIFLSIDRPSTQIIDCNSIVILPTHSILRMLIVTNESDRIVLWRFGVCRPPCSLDLFGPVSRSEIFGSRTGTVEQG